MNKSIVHFKICPYFFCFCFTCLKSILSYKKHFCNLSVEFEHSYVITCGNRLIQVSQGGREWEAKAPPQTDKQLLPWRAAENSTPYLGHRPAQNLKPIFQPVPTPTVD